MNEISQQDKEDLEDLLALTTLRHKEFRVLSRLLGGIRAQKNQHLVQRVRMGEVSSYLMSVDLRWVAEKAGFAADLPIFRESGEGSKRIPASPETVQTIKQLQPDWRRQLDMVLYLAMHRHHKFPPLVLVGYQGWVHDDRHEKWGVDGLSMNDSLTIYGLEPTGSYWGLDDSRTQFYALDGQHRLMAVLGLRDLIQTGYLHALDENRKPGINDKGLYYDDVVDYISKTAGDPQSDVHERLQHLMDECIGVEVVPAVRQGENLRKALDRLRQMFADINANAKESISSKIPLIDKING